MKRFILTKVLRFFCIVIKQRGAEMYTDIKSIQILISLLKEFDIKDIVLSPGGSDIPLIHSIETDQFFNCYSVVDERSAAYFALGKIKKREKTCFEKASKLLFLTNADLQRGQELYRGINFTEKSVILPICIENSNYDVDICSANKGCILLTGSLWYGVNAEGAIWFITHVWESIKTVNQNIQLIIAGARPNETIKKLCNNHDDIFLIDTPESMAPYYSKAEIYVAPVFDGAGMKVKVAEALSWGLPVVATDHALIGYEGVENICYRANTAKDFIDQINKFLQNHPSKRTIRNQFMNLYSIEKSVNIVKNCLPKGN